MQGIFGDSGGVFLGGFPFLQNEMCEAQLVLSAQTRLEKL